MATAFDLVVIGSGPGGYVAAIRAAQLGMRVACVEREKTLGGTCLNVGCIPSKALLDSTELLHQAQHDFAAHGLRTTVDVDLATMLARKDKIVRGFTTGIAGLFKKHGVTPVTGTARIVGPGRVAVGSDVLDATRILIATGSVPTALRDVPFDGDRVISSTEALRLGAVPRRLLVIGGGAIGLELGSVWRRLGAEVTVVEFLDRIVPTMDKAMGVQLRRLLEKQGLRFQLETQATGAERTADGVRVALAHGGTTTQIDVDRVLVAVGRRPNVEGLGAAEAGIAIDERGRITVDDRFQTSVPGIFAVGDVIRGPMLAHKAEDEGVAAVEGMAGLPVHVNYDAIPAVVYTAPELASVGLSEEDARARGHVVRIGTAPFMPNGRARAMQATDGVAKVIADATTDRILGVHILGARASDLIAEAVVALEFSASAEDLARTCHAHPTLPEVVREAALAVAQRPLHL